MRGRTWLALVIAWLAYAPMAIAQDAEAPEEEFADVEESEPPSSPDRAGEEETPRPPWRWPGVVIEELTFRIHIPPESGFDRALAAHRYGDAPVAPSVTFGVSLPIGVEWLWLGGRAGVRGRTWDHRYVEDASLVGVDLLVVLRARLLLGARIELGIAVGGGLGWTGIWMNGTMNDQFLPRFDVAAELAIGIGNHFSLGPRFGWDYFQWSGLDEYGHGVDAGGPYVALALEGRE